VFLARSDHGGQNGLGGGALDHAPAEGWARGVEAFGQAEELRQPVEDDGLELSDGRGADPVETGPAEGGAVELAENGRVGGGTGEEGVEAGVLPRAGV